MTTEFPLHHRALAIIMPSLFDWAQKKNVALEPDGVEVVAQYALERIPEELLGGLLAFDADSIRAMRLAVNYTLDVLATMQLGHCLAELEGAEIADPLRILAIAEESVSRAHALAADPLDPVVWGDMMEMAAKQRNACKQAAAYHLREAGNV